MVQDSSDCSSKKNFWISLDEPLLAAIALMHITHFFFTPKFSQMAGQVLKEYIMKSTTTQKSIATALIVAGLLSGGGG